ncbi:cytochrome c biogenesis protein CcdA, partial [Streptomyces sp. ID01-9D]
MNGLLALAFAAGMIAPVNPCGFALLPAWITYALGDTATSPLPARLGRALRSGAALTIGFAGTLAAAGITVSAGARTLISAAPWLGLAVGVLLLLLGLAMLTGRSLTLRLPASPRRAAEG